MADNSSQPTNPAVTPASSSQPGKLSKAAGKLSKAASGVAKAGRALGGAGKTVIQIAASPYTGTTSRKDRILTNVPGFGIFGAGIGILLVIFLGLFGRGTAAFIFGAILCGVIGAAIGLFWSYFPKAGRSIMISITLIVFLAFVFVLIGYWRTGIMPAYFGEAGPKIGYGLAVIGDKLSCFNFMNDEKFRECWMPGGWETETQEEIIAIDVQFKTLDLSYDGKEKEVRAEVQVNNKVGEGTKFTIDPKCYIDNKQVDTESFGTKEGDMLVFYERDIMQKATIVCKVPADFLKDKNRIKAKIELTRPVIHSIQWPAYTIEKESLEKNENLPAEIFEGEGKMIGYAGIPYEFGIGVEESVPLTEGKHSLYIKLKKKVGYSGISEVKQINYLRVGSIGETAPLSNCEGFKREGDVFVIKDITEEKIKAEKIQNGKIFYCEVDVSPEEDPQKVLFKSEINYLVGFKKEQDVLITGTSATA